MAELIRRADENVTEQPRPCGDCSFCCKSAYIEELNKPADTWCPHFAKGVGCSIHAERPRACSAFQCIWTYAAVLDDRWRPDNAKFMMRSGPTEEFVIDVDPAHPDAWRREPFISQLRAWSDRRNGPCQMMLVRSRGRLLVIFPEGDVDLGPEQPGMPIESGYVIREGKEQPYADYIRPPSPKASS